MRAQQAASVKPCLLLPASCFLIFNGADRDRTGDPLVANQVLSQLSYRPDLLRRTTSKLRSPITIIK